MDFSGCDCKGTTITEGIFGETWTDGTGDQIFKSPEPKIIKSYTMTNINRMEVVVITWGATIVSLKCPDKFGRPADVVLGFDDLKSYTNPKINPFIGCILGRCANRIKDGWMRVRGKDYQLTTNDFNKKHHLHGGTNGFGRRVWESHVTNCSVIMSYLSEDDEEGYPGAVLATVMFKLTADSKLEISMRATTSKATIVNMSHGTMFNLAGHDTGETELRKHNVLLNCDRWTFADYTDPVPTGAVRGVGGTVMDLRIPRLLSDCMDKVPPGEGYDHNFCITKNWQAASRFVAKVWHARSGRVLEVYSDQPGVQFYTGGRLPPQPPSEFSSSYEDWSQVDENGEENGESYSSDVGGEESAKIAWRNTAREFEPLEFLPGKNKARYKKNCAMSIQPQNYPNAINHPHFPCSVLYPGQMYCHDLTYKFGIQLASYM